GGDRPDRLGDSGILSHTHVSSVTAATNAHSSGPNRSAFPPCLRLVDFPPQIRHRPDAARNLVLARSVQGHSRRGCPPEPDRNPRGLRPSRPLRQIQRNDSVIATATMDWPGGWIPSPPRLQLRLRYRP